MAAPIPYATAEGSLYELVARGNKDVFFFSEKPTSKFIFDNTYPAQQAKTQERRRTPPATAAEFGRTVEFELDLVGDILKSPAFLFTLPTWLPAGPVAAANPVAITTDASGVSYGYTNGIGYFLFEDILIYQDNILLQQFSGDALWAVHKPNGSFTHAFISNQQTGQHDGSPRSIGRNATPGQLRLEIPLIGCQRPEEPGFPVRAVPRHSYRIKAKLRRLEELVEASDGRPKPMPWDRTDFAQQTAAGQPPVPFHTVVRELIPPIKIELETIHVFVPRESQEELSKTPAEIPFRRLRETTFTQSAPDYLGVLGGGTSILQRRLEGRHPAERIVFFFRTYSARMANQLWKLFPGYTTVSLLIAGQTREAPRGPEVWRDLTNSAKEELDTDTELATMNWGLGAIAPLRYPGWRGRPTGSVNFTTADRPTLQILLLAPPDGDPRTELRVIVESWAAFETDGAGRAELLSMN